MRVEGVTRVVPDIALHTLTVNFDDSKGSIDKIKTTLAGAGFTLEEYPPEKSPSPPPP